MIRSDEARGRDLRAPRGRPQGGGELGAGRVLRDPRTDVSLFACALGCPREFALHCAYPSAGRPTSVFHLRIFLDDNEILDFDRIDRSIFRLIDRVRADECFSCATEWADDDGR